MSTNPSESIADTVGPSAWSKAPEGFEVEATRIRLEEFDVTLESGDVIETPRGKRTFERAVRNERGNWTLRYDGDSSGHGPEWARMMLRRGDWNISKSGGDA